MPINIQQALMFTFVIVMIIAILTATTYIIISNMISDAYRYEKAVERANEKIRIAAARGLSGLVYGIRNIGLTEVVIKEAGVIYASGTKTVLARNIVLEPGEIYVGRAGLSGFYTTFYVITSRGNIYSTDVVDFTRFYKSHSVYIRDLIPATYVFKAPISYSGSYVYTLSVSMYGYVFGFLIADDPYSDDSIYLQIGPKSVADLYKNRDIPYRETASKSSSRLSASMSLILEISNDKSEGLYPHYKLTVPIKVTRLDDKSGLLIYTCFGFIWRTMTSNVFGYKLVNAPGVLRRITSPTGDYYIETRFEADLIPSSLDVKSLVASLANWRNVNFDVDAPSGSQVYILLVKCYRIEDKTLRTFQTTYNEPWEDLHGAKLYTYIVFPGRTRVNNNDIENVNQLELKINFDPEIYVLTVLNSI